MPFPTEIVALDGAKNCVDDLRLRDALLPLARREDEQEETDVNEVFFTRARSRQTYLAEQIASEGQTPLPQCETFKLRNLAHVTGTTSLTAETDDVQGW